MRKINIFQVDRHLKSKCHLIAVEIENGRPMEEQDSDIQIVRSGPSQARIDTLTTLSSKEAYNRLMITAYNMALHPTMPLRHFRMLIKIQRENGVRFIEGKHS